MPQHLHLDFETFSKAELSDVGAYRYAFDPSTEILCAGMALGNEEPAIWFPDYWRDGTSLEKYWDALENPEVLIYAHNAQMEMAISQALMHKTWGIKCPDLSRFRCTMSIARRAALPSGLDKLSEVLDLSSKKDKRGKALIRKFCILQNAKKPTKKNPAGVPIHRIFPKDDPTAFQDLMEYCKQDVRAEMEITERLAYFDDPINNRNYTLDAVINARGVPVNLDALRHAQKLIEEETEIVGAQFRELTGFNITQNAVFLKWLKERGAELEDLQAETIETYLDSAICPTCNGEGETGTDADIECEGFLSCPACGGTSSKYEPATAALLMKQSTAFASIKKVATMLACAGPHDNRIRGMLGHHGATTGRWINNLVQFQNMKRPAAHMAGEPEKGTTWSEIAYADICNGISLEMLRICYGPPLEVISSCIRHFVHDV